MDTFVQAGITKIKHLTTTEELRTAEEVAAMAGLRSVRLVQRFLAEVWAALPAALMASLKHQATNGEEDKGGC